MQPSPNHAIRRSGAPSSAHNAVERALASTEDKCDVCVKARPVAECPCITESLKAELAQRRKRNHLARQQALCQRASPGQPQSTNRPPPAAAREIRPNRAMVTFEEPPAGSATCEDQRHCDNRGATTAGPEERPRLPNALSALKRELNNIIILLYN